MTEISSRSNAHFKRWSSLLGARGIKAERQALVSGPKLVRERLVEQPASVREILLPPDAEGLQVDLRQFRLTAPLFRELDVIGTKSPMAVVETPPLETWTPRAPAGLEVVLALSDPGNLGAALRSAEAFGASRVLLTRECASPYLPKALRASAGATWRMKLSRAESLADLNLGAFASVGLDMNGKNLRAFTFPRDLFVVLGEEGRGLPDSFSGQRVSIAMAGEAESLNALAAFSIALYEYASQSRLKSAL